MSEEYLRDQVQSFVRLFGLLNQQETPCGQPLSPSQAHALQVLGARSPLSQQELAAELRLDKSTTSRLVTQMADRGWVERSENPANRREVQLSLTVQGENLLANVRAASRERFAEIWDKIPPDQRAKVLESLGVLTQVMKEM